MICKVCGRIITNEQANFCEYCGASFRPGTDNKLSEEFVRSFDNTKHQADYNAGSYTQAMSQQTHPGQGTPGQNVNIPRSFQRGLFDSTDRPMTLGNWMIIYLLPFIPMVGMVLFLVVLFTWGFGPNVAPTKKNWARATLIMALVVIIMLSFIISSGYLGDPNTVLQSLYGTGRL